MQSKTARRAGAGNWDFLASWRRGEQKQTSAEAPESRGAGRWRRNPDLWYPVLLVVAGILFFWDPLFSSKNFYFRDILNFHYPLHKIMIDSYARGEFPLWNPYVYLGQPMLANPNYMAFYPTNLFHLFLPFNYAFKLHFIVHPILGGLGLYFLQRRLGITALAAFGGSLVYQFSGPVLSFLNLYSIVQAVALMPWTGWALIKALYDCGWRRTLVFGSILALQIVTFEPLLLQSSLGLLTGLALVYLLESEQPAKAMGRILRVAVIGGMFGLALAAVQVIPTLELIARAARGAGYDYRAATTWSMHPADLANLVVPRFFGDVFTMDWATYWGERFHSSRDMYLVSSFVGSGTTLLAAVAFLSQRKKLKAILFVLILTSILLAFGEFNPLYRWLYDHVPGLDLGRYPSKYFLLGTLALAIFASLGLEVIMGSTEENARNRGHVMALGILGMMIAIVILGACFYFALHPNQLQPWIRAKVEPARAAAKDFATLGIMLRESLRSTGIFLLLSSALIFLSCFWKRPAWISALFVLTLGAELIPANLQLAPLISGADVDFVPEVNHFLQQVNSGAPRRIFSRTWMDPVPGIQLSAPNRSYAWLTLFYRRSGQPKYGIMNGIQYSVDFSTDGLNTRESDQLWQALAVLSPAAGLTLMQKLNTPLLLSPGQILDPRVRLTRDFETGSNLRLNLFRLEDSLPRAYFASRVCRADSHADALRQFVSFERADGNAVILEGPEIEEGVGRPDPGAARIVEYESARVVCEVDARTSGYLVLLDSYYPGWRAYLEGKEAEILRANYAFRAVRVPEGKHRVEFVYRPRSFHAGLSLTGFALLFGVVALFWHPRRRSFRDGETG